MADDEGYDAAAAPAQHEDELDAELFGTDDDDDLQTDQQQPEARQEGDTGFQGDQGGDAAEEYDPEEEPQTVAPVQRAPEPEEYQPADDDVEDWGGHARHDEAQEVGEGEEDEIEAMFKKKKKRRVLDHTEKRKIVDNLLAQMEVAAEMDMEENRNRRPALNKLRHLPEVEEVMTQKDLHDDLLDSGVLGVMKSWLEPLPDGNLPSVKVRTVILRLLLQLNFFFEDRKEQLKKSGLGHVIMFLSELPDEQPHNRKVAKEIVQKWSRPIFDQYRSDRHEEAAAEREADDLRAQARRQQAAPRRPEDDSRALRPKDKGFRYNAAVPQPAKLNYKQQPSSSVAADPVHSGASRKAPALRSDRMVKKLNDLSKRSRQSGTAVKVSIQGKDVG
mmetsp:Transcript_1679/g.4862  ORF Transcript_1679/g.4862 Transcript_1679/m.4862 type:complete len:388 (-) Transcript_1679:304-1467(-)